MNQTGGSALVRHMNESAILDVLQERGPLTRTDVAAAVGLSSPTVTRIVSKLLDERLILEKEWGDSKGGRRPALIEFNRRAGLIVGFDLSDVNLRCAVLDLDGEAVARETFPLAPGPATLEDVLHVIRTLLAHKYCEPIVGISIGVPGITRDRDGVVAWSARFGWRNLPLKAIIEEKFGVPTFVENSANLAALGEHWRGAGRQVQNLICISIGPGIGAGIILKGELFRGERDGAGEIGYLVLDEDDISQGPGGRGYFEQVAGEQAIAAQGYQVFGAGASRLTPQELAALAARGDALAGVIVERAARRYALAVANAACLLDPALIILRGWVEHENVIELIARHVQCAVPVAPRIVASARSEDAVLVGGVALALRATNHRVARGRALMH